MTDSFDDPTDDTTHRGGFGEFAGEATGLIDRSFREQIVLVGVQLPGASDDQVDANLNELAQLVDTAGADPVDRVIQKREAPDPATYVGKGKATAIQETSDGLDADTVVFDDEQTVKSSCLDVNAREFVPKNLMLEDEAAASGDDVATEHRGRSSLTGRPPPR